jgi:hypothetical protein
MLNVEYVMQNGVTVHRMITAVVQYVKKDIVCNVFSGTQEHVTSAKTLHAIKKNVPTLFKEDIMIDTYV